MQDGDGQPHGSHAASRLLANRNRILELWEERLRQAVPAAADEHHPILINTMPALLRQYAEALSPNHPRRTGTEGTNIAEEHGGERVRVTDFRLQDVILEYKLLREVILEVVDLPETPLTPDERTGLNASIDESLMKSCTAYALAESMLREQLFALLAHDLRGPMTAAKFNVDMVLRQPSSDQIPRWAARATHALERADRMLVDLLDAMRVQSGGRLQVQLEETDLVEVAQEALDNLRAVHGDRFVLVAPEPVRGHFSRELLRRAIENLGNNAVKYGSSHRPITLTVRHLHGRAFAVMHNHGGTIPPEQQETLFQVFHRLRGAEESGQKGWGLGLAQVRGAAEAHAGSVGVDSLPERGTSFTIDIPCDPRPHLDAPQSRGI